MSKPKAVNVQVIPRVADDGTTNQIHEIAERLIAAHHPHLASAAIAFAWANGWHEDADGRLKLGVARKATDLDRELHGWDWIIQLNHPACLGFNAGQIEALIDHELCHCQEAKDAEGETKVDEKGRTCWRVRHHDIEEFTEVVDRHGLWIHDLEQFAKSVMAKSKGTNDESRAN